jgi:type IV secretory pathway VirB10-like protein
MAFNTTSYLAGVGSVVVILSTGFAGGYLLAYPTHPDPPNRLQRLALEGQDTRPVATPATKPEIVAAAAPAAPTSAPAPATPQPAVTEPPAQPASVPIAAKAPEPVRSSAAQVNVERSGAEKARIAEARAAERKRAEARRFAERQRKQRELEVATVAVRQMMHDRNDEQFAAMDRPEPPPEMPRLFGR